MTREDLESLQKTPLKYKEMLTADKLRELMRYVGYDPEAFYVSFSGGKDSMCLLSEVARNMQKLGYCSKGRGEKLHVLYVNTGLEYDAVRNHIKPFIRLMEERYQIDIALDVRVPQQSFKEVLKTYGYPVISKEVAQVIEEARKGLSRADGTYLRSREKITGKLLDKNGEKSQFNCEKYLPLLSAPFKISKHCCPITKQNPAKKYEKETGRIPVIGTLAEESSLRQSKWMRFGCNAFSCDRPQSAPLSFWTEQDILHYIRKHDLPLALPYGHIRRKADPAKGFFNGQIPIFDIGDENEFLLELELSGAKRTGCCYCLFGIQFDPERILRMQKLEPKKADFVLRGGEFDENGVWGPSDEGLGFWYVCDYLTSVGIPVPYDNTNNYRQDWAIDIAA